MQSSTHLPEGAARSPRSPPSDSCSHLLAAAAVTLVITDSVRTATWSFPGTRSAPSFPGTLAPGASAGEALGKTRFAGSVLLWVRGV